MNFVTMDGRFTVDPANPVINFPLFSAPGVDVAREAVLLFRVNPNLAGGQAGWTLTLNGAPIFVWTHTYEDVRGWVEVVTPGALIAANNALVMTWTSGASITMAEVVFIYKT